MKIRFFLLGTENHVSVSRTENELKQIFASCLSDDGDIQSFDTIRDATTDIAKAVTDSHVLVFISDTEQYATTKKMLSKAFGFTLACDSALLGKACETLGKDTGEEDGDFSVAHAFVPRNAKTFVLPDGLYSGFSVANGNQTIILLPLEKARTSVLVCSQVVPYLNASYHVNISADALKKYNGDRLYEALSLRNVSLAVAGTNTANFLKEYLSLEERPEGKVVISPLAEKRGNLQPVDYVVNLSITAAELMSCPYSVAISNAFYTGDSPESEKIVYLAVSNERETAVREIRSLPGEDISSFLGRCCGDLCVFVCDVLSDDDAFKTDIKTRESAAVKRYKIAIAAASAVLVALLIFIAVYFTANSYSIGTWYDNFMEWVFPAGNPLDDLFGRDPGADESTEGTTEQGITSIFTTEAAATEEASTEEEASSEVFTEENTASGNEQFVVG
ncbi:MAG: hypothetical protein J6A97_07110 [Clostridia bacterium]|nr:hypothetical protein [Clostridia bacterium]